MTQSELSILLVVLPGVPLSARAQSADACADLTHFKLQAVEITKSELFVAGTTVPPTYPGGQRARIPSILTSIFRISLVSPVST